MVKYRQWFAQCPYVTEEEEEEEDGNTAAPRECPEEERKPCLSHGYVFSTFSLPRET